MLSSAFYIQILIIARISSFAISVESHVYHAVERGSSNTFDYRIYIANLQGIVSPFHDIPLRANDNASVVNMVVEIPRWTNSKMETSRDEKMNPIKQDTKNGKLRFTKNIFPHHGYIWNYGGIPQTWENPNYLEPATETWGDNDPVDALEIGSKVQKTGSVIQVKVLGTMCLIDEGETDWKMIVIDVNDRLADQFNDIDDVERLMPGYLTTMNKWLRTYKIPDGKQENVIAFDGIAQDRMTAMRVINEAHQQWKDLVTDPTVDKHGIAWSNDLKQHKIRFHNDEDSKNLDIEDEEMTEMNSDDDEPAESESEAGNDSTETESEDDGEDEKEAIGNEELFTIFQNIKQVLDAEQSDLEDEDGEVDTDPNVVGNVPISVYADALVTKCMDIMLQSRRLQNSTLIKIIRQEIKDFIDEGYAYDEAVFSAFRKREFLIKKYIRNQLDAENNDDNSVGDRSDP